MSETTDGYDLQKFIFEFGKEWGIEYFRRGLTFDEACWESLQHLRGERIQQMKEQAAPNKQQPFHASKETLFRWLDLLQAYIDGGGGNDNPRYTSMVGHLRRFVREVHSDREDVKNFLRKKRITRPDILLENRMIISGQESNDNTDTSQCPDCD